MQRALLIDKNYMALSIITWKKAVKLLAKGKVEFVDTVKQIVINRGINAFSISSILRLVVEIPWRAHQSRMRFSRRNLMIRDNHECQYCGIKLGKSGTIDHVVPRARGGKTSYLNCVASCKLCNATKRDLTPEQAGMRLRGKPKKPSFLALYRRYLDQHSPKEWSDYIIGL